MSHHRGCCCEQAEPCTPGDTLTVTLAGWVEGPCFPEGVPGVNGSHVLEFLPDGVPFNPIIVNAFTRCYFGNAAAGCSEVGWSILGYCLPPSSHVAVVGTNFTDCPVNFVTQQALFTVGNPGCSCPHPNGGYGFTNQQGVGVFDQIGTVSVAH